MSAKIHNDTANGSVTLKASDTPTGDIVVTAPEFSADMGVRPVLRTAQITTSGTFKDFVDIPNWVKKITVMFVGVSTNGTSNPIVQLGTNAGIEVTNYLGTAQFSGNASNYASGVLLMDNSSVAASYIRHGKLEFDYVGDNTWVVAGVITNSSTPVACITGGSKVLSGTLDRIRITTVNGTDLFDAGTVNIKYEG